MGLFRPGRSEAPRPNRAARSGCAAYVASAGGQQRELALVTYVEGTAIAGRFGDDRPIRGTGELALIDNLGLARHNTFGHDYALLWILVTGSRSFESREVGLGSNVQHLVAHDGKIALHYDDAIRVTGGGASGRLRIDETEYPPMVFQIDVGDETACREFVDLVIATREQQYAHYRKEREDRAGQAD